MITNKFKIVIPISIIQEIVCDYFDVSIDKILEITRKREIVTIRQIMMFFCCIYSNETLNTVGIQNGKKDSATVFHARKSIYNLYDTDKQIRKEIEEINNKIVNWDEGVKRSIYFKNEFGIDYNVRYLSKLSVKEYNSLCTRLRIDRQSNIKKEEIIDIIKDNIIHVLIKHYKNYNGVPCFMT